MQQDKRLRAVLGLGLVVLGGLVLAGPGGGAEAAGQKLDCRDPQTQTDMTLCAGEDYEQADRDLNAQWKVTRKALAEWDQQLQADQRGGEKALLKGQRAWIDYRDGQCEAYGFSARGGTMEPMLVAQCMADLTRTRTEELKELAKSIAGEE